jgi:hypothetical protein
LQAVLQEVRKVVVVVVVLVGIALTHHFLLHLEPQ